MNTEIEKLRKEIEVLKRTLQPIGCIQCFATLNVPDCWLPCDGRELMVRMYPELYQKIGNVFGGVPNKTFCLPDLQGRFIRGWDRDWNLDSQREFGSTQEDAIQGHTHMFNSSELCMSSSGGHSHAIYFKTEETGSMFKESNFRVRWIYENEVSGSYQEKTASDGSHSHYLWCRNNPISEIESSAYGDMSGKVAIETRPKNLALLYCIKVK